MPRLARPTPCAPPNAALEPPDVPETGARVIGPPRTLFPPWRPSPLERGSHCRRAGDRCRCAPGHETEATDEDGERDGQDGRHEHPRRSRPGRPPAGAM